MNVPLYRHGLTVPFYVWTPILLWIVGPIFFAAQLLANLVVFWIVLGLEAFSREMQIGTYVIVVSVILLIENGPSSQEYDEGSFQDLISQPYAIIWACFLTGAMLITGIILAISDLKKQQPWFRYTVLLVARASAFSLNLSTGKALVLHLNTVWLAVNIIFKIVSGAIYTGAIVVQSTAVEQKVFVPINAATIIFTNAVTGLAIWEDFKVVNSWMGYVCVFLLLALGCGLLLSDLGLLQETAPETFRGARLDMVYKEHRQEMLERLRNFGRINWDEAINEEVSSVPDLPDNRKSMSESVLKVKEGGIDCRRSSTKAELDPRRQAWISIYESTGCTSVRSATHLRLTFSATDGIDDGLVQGRDTHASTQQHQNHSHATSNPQAEFLGHDKDSERSQDDGSFKTNP
jgi:hypothetical protein